MRKPKKIGSERTKKGYDKPYRVDRSRNLNELEGWKPTLRGPGEVTTSLIDACEPACARPIGSLAADELTRLLQQRFPGHFLVPLALEILREDTLLSARGVPGDLLQAVVGCGEGFWQDHPYLRHQVRDLIAAHELALAQSDQISAAIALAFLRRHQSSLESCRPTGPDPVAGTAKPSRAQRGGEHRHKPR